MSHGELKEIRASKVINEAPDLYPQKPPLALMTLHSHATQTFQQNNPLTYLDMRQQSHTLTIWPDGRDMYRCLNVNSVNMKSDRCQSSSTKR